MCSYTYMLTSYLSKTELCRWIINKALWFPITCLRLIRYFRLPHAYALKFGFYIIYHIKGSSWIPMSYKISIKVFTSPSFRNPQKTGMKFKGKKGLGCKNVMKANVSCNGQIGKGHPIYRGSFTIWKEVINVIFFFCVCEFERSKDFYPFFSFLNQQAEFI